MSKTTASRYHDISAGHRVHGHESKCAHLHGHNYRIHFHCRADSEKLDDVGRVIDFSVIKSKLCMWVEENWDHRFLVSNKDPLWSYLLDLDPTVVITPFNPTAENMAKYLVESVAPFQLATTGVTLYKVEIEETAKCSATYELGEVEYDI